MLSVSVLAPVVLCYKLAACMYKFPFCEICTDGIIFLILNEGNALRYLVVILFARRERRRPRNKTAILWAICLNINRYTKRCAGKFRPASFRRAICCLPSTSCAPGSPSRGRPSERRSTSSFRTGFIFKHQGKGSIVKGAPKGIGILSISRYERRPSAARTSRRTSF